MKTIPVILITIILFTSLVQAQEFPSYQNTFVNDFANILSPTQVQEIGQLLSQIKTDTTAEVVLVTINSTEGRDPNIYAAELGQEWGVGKKENDNGLVILYAVTENKIAVSTGYGMGGILPASKIGRILDETYVPLRDSGNTTQGIVEATKALVQVIQDNKERVLANEAQPNNIIITIIPIIIIILLIGSIAYAFSKRKRKKGAFDFLDFLLIDFIIRTILYSIIFRGGNRSSGGFGGSSFGGGGFGGGGFSGGGASR